MQQTDSEFLVLLNFKRETREGILTQLLGQLGDILFALKFQSSVTISEEAPGSGSLYASQLVRMEGRLCQTLFRFGQLT